MATTTSRPGRPLVAIGIVLVLLFGTMAFAKLWGPKLGLDLRGGTTITLTASAAGTGGAVTSEKLAEAKDIIGQRVNGAGIGEAEITTSGSDHIQVAVPGVNQESLVRQVGQTALLRFRIVYAMDAGTPPPVLPTPNPSGTPKPSTTPNPTAKPSGTPTAKPSVPPSVTPPATPGSTPAVTPSSTPRGRALTSVLLADPTPTPGQPSAPATTPPVTPSAPASTPAVTPSAPVSAPPTLPSTPVVPPAGSGPLAWQPDAATQASFAAFKCADKPAADDATKPLVTCDREGTTKFLLGPAVLEGTDLSEAFAGIPQSGFQWQVNLKFNGTGAKKFADATTFLSQKPDGQNQFAIVLDSKVISPPSVNEPITGGEAQITGTFTEKEAQDLANVLKYGALPLAFEVSEVSNVSPQLGGDQLDAGILAGLIGLAIVVLYSFLYYRGLGLVVVLSLAVAAALTYALVVLLGKSLGFTLTLAGIAGLIVAIGITADSFVVFFERLRDEIREGRSLRTAVETGWHRARHTIIAADSITLLAAVVLYMLAVGGVKGFAFALGLTTLVDLVVVFFFTKPLVTLLAKTDFFGHGHRLSGLDPKSLGVERLPGQLAPIGRRTRTAGGEA